MRVLDLTNVLAGPFCTYQLALLGAEVVKIEAPGRGDLSRRLGADPHAAARGMGTSYVAVNAGKQSVTLNLKHPDGRYIFRQLVEEANAVVENYRPGVMNELGLDHEALLEVNPALVYCAITGFGQTGPLSRRPAYDQIIQGISGVMSVTGDSASAPLRVGYPICDTVGGVMAALAITAALFEARATGRGRMVDVSMLETTLATMGWVVSNYLNAGVEPRPIGNDNFTAAPSGAFQTGDGLLNIAANEERQFEALCEVIGRRDLRTNPRYAERDARRRHRMTLKCEIEKALAARSAAEWEALLIAARVPAGRVLTVPEILGHPHLRERAFVKELHAPEGRQLVTRSGFQFGDGDVEPPRPAPRLSQHTEWWLERLGYDAPAIERLRAQGVI